MNNAYLRRKLKPSAVPSIKEYYDHTRFDYRTIWFGKKNLSIHFGYYDDEATVHHAALENMNKQLAAWGDISATDKVLDAGCGTGGSCFWLAENLGCEVTGITVVESQYQDCLKNLEGRPNPKIHFACADYTATGFPDASFDVVWALESVCHAPQKLDFYKEAFRLLKPNGRLIMADYFRCARPVSRRGEQLLQEWLRPWAIADIDTSEEHQTHANAVGFSNPKTKDVTQNTRVSLRNLHHLCKKWLPFGHVFRFFHIVNDIRLNNVKASIRQYEALEEGAWFYAFFRADKA